jgi:hypothetical protein
MTEAEGIQAIIDLQMLVGYYETVEQATKSWKAFSEHEKEQTKLAHQAMKPLIDKVKEEN